MQRDCLFRGNVIKKHTTRVTSALRSPQVHSQTQTRNGEGNVQFCPTTIPQEFQRLLCSTQFKRVDHKEDRTRPHRHASVEQVESGLTPQELGSFSQLSVWPSVPQLTARTPSSFVPQQNCMAPPETGRNRCRRRQRRRWAAEPERS